MRCDFSQHLALLRLVIHGSVTCLFFVSKTDVSKHTHFVWTWQSFLVLYWENLIPSTLQTSTNIGHSASVMR